MYSRGEKWPYMHVSGVALNYSICALISNSERERKTLYRNVVGVNEVGLVLASNETHSRGID